MQYNESENILLSATCEKNGEFVLFVYIKYRVSDGKFEALTILKKFVRKLYEPPHFLT